MTDRPIDYHQNFNVRRYEVAFGELFANIPLARTDRDGKILKLIERVPLALVNGDKFLRRLNGQARDDGGLDTKFHEVFPRMTYQMTGLSYDAPRKVQEFPNRAVIGHENRTQRVVAAEPWKLDFELNIAAKTKTDAWAIAEQIMLMFVPHMTFVLDGFPETGQHTDVPMFLEGVSVEDTYDGDISDDTRKVVITMNFHMNAKFFGPVGSKLEYDVLRRLDGPDAVAASEYAKIRKVIIGVFGSSTEFEREEGVPDMTLTYDTE